MLQLFVLLSCGSHLACHLPSMEQGSLHQWSLRTSADSCIWYVATRLQLQDIYIKGGGTHGHMIFMNHCLIFCFCSHCSKKMDPFNRWQIWMSILILHQENMSLFKMTANITMLSLSIISFYQWPMNPTLSVWWICHWVFLKWQNLLHRNRKICSPDTLITFVTANEKEDESGL